MVHRLGGVAQLIELEWEAEVEAEADHIIMDLHMSTIFIKSKIK